MADEEEEWTPSDSQLTESQASVAAPARRRLRKKAEAEAQACAPPPPLPPSVDEPVSVPLELEDKSEPPPAPLTSHQAPAVATTSPANVPSSPQPRTQPEERATPAAASPALTPSRLDWARGLAAAAGASLLGSMLRRFSLSPLPAAPAAAAVLVDSPPLEEPTHDVAPVRRRRLRKKRSLEASSQLPLDSPAASGVDDAADALADALAGVTLARPAAALAPPPPSPPAPPPQAAEVVRSEAPSSSEASTDDSSSSSSDDDDDDDDDSLRPAPRPAPRASQPAARAATASDGPLVTGDDNEVAVEGAQPQRMEFTDAASGARCVSLSAFLRATRLTRQRLCIPGLCCRRRCRRACSRISGRVSHGCGIATSSAKAAFWETTWCDSPRHLPTRARAHAFSRPYRASARRSKLQRFCRACCAAVPRSARS